MPASVMQMGGQWNFWCTRRPMLFYHMATFLQILLLISLCVSIFHQWPLILLDNYLKNVFFLEFWGGVSSGVSLYCIWRLLLCCMQVFCNFCCLCFCFISQIFPFFLCCEQEFRLLQRYHQEEHRCHPDLLLWSHCRFHVWHQLGKWDIWLFRWSLSSKPPKGFVMPVRSFGGLVNWGEEQGLGVVHRLC